MLIKALSVAALVAGVSVAPALSQPAQDPASAVARGQIDLTYSRSQKTPSAAERTPLQAKGVRLRDLLLATPALADPRGFGLHASVVLEKPVASRAGDTDAIWGAVISRRIVIARSKPDAAGRYPGDGEGPALQYAINKLSTAFGAGANASGFFALPAQRQEQGGVMRFAQGGRNYMIVTPPGVQAFVPVTIGEYLNATIKREQANGSPEYAATLRASLAGLSPAEQALPFCETNTGTTDYVAHCRHSSAKPLFKTGPRLFVGSGAGSKARMIVLSVPQLGKIGDQQERQRLREAAGQLSVQSLQALLD
jgi:hypothetical protein